MDKPLTKLRGNGQRTNVLMMSPSDEAVNTGIEKKARNEIARGLSQILADSYVLMIKTHMVHWNVVGPLFHSIHVLTEEQYKALFEAIDVIAERVRALGYTVPHDKNGFFHSGKGLALPAKLPSAKAMLEDLIADHEAAARSIRRVAKLSDDNEDFVTTDMLAKRLTFHEKAVWMLRAMSDD